MKIVFVSPVGVIGGAERVLLTLFAALQATQPEVKLYLIAGSKGPLLEEAENIGVQVKLLKLPEQINELGDSAFKGKNRVTAMLTLLLRVTKILPAFQQYLEEFRLLLQQINPDLIHSNGIKSHIIIALCQFISPQPPLIRGAKSENKAHPYRKMVLVGIKSIPTVWHIHDFYSSRTLMAVALKWASTNVKGAIAISQAVAQDAQTVIPVPIEVIYNTVNINYFSPAETPITSSPIRVGLVATFARWKGHDIFLKAAADILHRRPDLNVQFCIVGGAIYKTRGSQLSLQELQENASQLGITDKVDFLGFQHDIVKVYRQLDIIVHASTQPEPFGLAIIEAMACAKPVIVSLSGGAAELVTHNYDAIGVPPGNSQALASAIQYLLENPERRTCISKNARVSVEKRFSDENLGDKILAVYAKVARFPTSSRSRES
jgi:glycosyltransferase involved in cell wall biosynthesis